MNSNKYFLLALVTSAAVMGASQTANAAIIGFSGAVSLIAPPASVETGMLESDTIAYLFEEKTDLLLASDLTVNIIAPGTYTGSIDPTALISSGQSVNSYFVHMDHVGTSSTAFDYEGSITFDSDVLGLATSESKLDGTDLILGLGSVDYPTGDGGIARGSIDSAGTFDTITLSPDRRTVTFRLRHNSVNVEQFRIITVVPEPGGVALVCLALAGAIGLVRRQAR